MIHRYVLTDGIDIYPGCPRLVVLQKKSSRSRFLGPSSPRKNLVLPMSSGPDSPYAPSDTSNREQHGRQVNFVKVQVIEVLQWPIPIG